MEYKTPFIAKKLGVSPKAVVRIAQQLNLTIEKINMVTLFLHKMI
ncbi:polar chromosome segregation protein [Bacillus cereus]|nr:polar chromosome segregation protein [Bacillus cereus]